MKVLIFMEEDAEAYLFCTWVPDGIISLTLISLSNRKCRKVKVMRWRRILTSDTNSQEEDRLWKGVPTLAPRPGRGQEPWLWWKGNYTWWGKGRNILFVLEAPFKREKAADRRAEERKGKRKREGAREVESPWKQEIHSGGESTALSEWGRLNVCPEVFCFSSLLSPGKPH